MSATTRAATVRERLPNLDHQQCHVVMLFRPSGEAIGLGDDAINNFRRCQRGELLRALNHLLFAPLVILSVHRLANPVRVAQQDVSRQQFDRTLNVARPRQ